MNLLYKCSVKNSRVCWLITFLQLTFLTVIWICLSLTNHLKPSNTRQRYLKHRSYSTQQGKEKIHDLVKRCSINNIRCIETTSDNKHTKLSKLDSECSLQNLLKDCNLFKNVHGYTSFTAEEEEINFPLAFSIKLHKNPEQAEQLLRNIYRPHNVYCIYVDNKASLDIYNTFLKLSNCFDNIYIIEKRLSIVYASIFHVYAELQCMIALLKSSVKWRYFINLTGQEFPLKTNHEIVQILKLLNGANDIESFKFPYYLKYRVQKKFSMFKKYMVKEKEPKVPFIYKIDLRKGSAYGMFTRAFVKYVIEDDIAREFITWTADTLSPEETVWSTLNALPWAPGGYKVETKHSAGTFVSRAMIWKWDKLPCSGKFVRHVCVLGIRDIPWLSTRHEIFANKFDISVDNSVLDCMEIDIRNRTLNYDNNSLDLEFYKNLSQAKIYSSKSDFEKSEMRLKQIKSEWLKAQK